MTNSNRYPLDQSALYKITSKTKLSELLGVPIEDIELLLKTDNYSEFERRPKNQIDHPLFKKKPRLIQNPNNDLKKLQRRILKLLNKIQTPEYLFSATKGLTYIDNAKRHKNFRFTYCIDIKNFYQSTTSKQVQAFFLNEMKCSDNVSLILTSLACYHDKTTKCPILPTGGPASPILSFWVNRKMFDNLYKFALDYKLTMTVYVDDVTFSGTTISMKMKEQIKSIISSYNLTPHKPKYYGPQEWKVITGGAVKGGVIKPPTQLKAKLRIASYELMRQSPKSESLKLSVRGLASSIAQFDHVAQGRIEKKRH